MQKGPILMEPITIKARLNQAYHFSGQPETASVFPIFQTARLSFSARTHGCTQPFCSCRRAHQLRVPRPSDTGCAAVTSSFSMSNPEAAL